ncbi:hypothetical protein G4G31_15955 [Massilia sp. Se16.2.3]|nr:hypothetical protein [Massilia sp. Se16.2.3]QNA97565.1 hypothetical protein G4G31_15955 [Massilia sp. Se16.2.3]
MLDVRAAEHDHGAQGGAAAYDLLETGGVGLVAAGSDEDARAAVAQQRGALWRRHGGVDEHESAAGRAGTEQRRHRLDARRQAHRDALVRSAAAGAKGRTEAGDGRSQRRVAEPVGPVAQCGCGRQAGRGLFYQFMGQLGHRVLRSCSRAPDKVSIAGFAALPRTGVLPSSPRLVLKRRQAR